ncbi:LD-carboxypeptidase [Treponema lecithinolyticum]|uniref:S66 family peptidase n=1 Tax=Treponema lecithinolyticum TaxID=53418 RepID=UPI0028E9EE38|nr:LD-carboxypeptidase [Treponema lecithinolyticum]
MLKPQHLVKGDTVAIVSLSSGFLGESVFIHKYDIAKQRLEKNYGLHVVAMPNALKGIDYLYKHPEARAQDLMDAFKNSEVKAVFCAIGGEDAIRLLPYIDFDVIKNNPKIFTGFSDTTVNHFMMYKAGLVSYYGLSVMVNIAEYVSINEYTKQAMEQTLFYPQNTLDIPCSSYCSYDTDKVMWGEENMHKATPRFANTGYEIVQGSGVVRGELLGGCVDVFLNLIGTPLWPSLDQWKGKLLLLETSEENMSAGMLKAVLRNLCAQGIFDVISGIVVGKPAFSDKAQAYKEVYKTVVGFEAGHAELPVLFNVNVGHAYPIGLFPLGLTYEIDCDKQTFRLMESATL